MFALPAFARATRSSVRATLPDVGFDHQLAAAAKTCAIDLQVFHNPRDIVARFGDRDALDPVDRINARITRIAIGRDPLLHPAASGVVAGERENVRTVIAAE